MTIPTVTIVSAYRSYPIDAVLMVDGERIEHRIFCREPEPGCEVAADFTPYFAKGSHKTKFVDENGLPIILNGNFRVPGDTAAEALLALPEAYEKWGKKAEAEFAAKVMLAPAPAGFDPHKMPNGKRAR